MTEKEFCTRVVNTFLAQGHWAYKIPDAPVFKGMNTKFNRPRPFDVVACVRGKALAIECKLVKTIPRRFGTLRKLFTPSQLKHLTEFESFGKGRSFVFLCEHRHGFSRDNRKHLVHVIPWHRLARQPDDRRIVASRAPLIWRKGKYIQDVKRLVKPG